MTAYPSAALTCRPGGIGEGVAVWTVAVGVGLGATDTLSTGLGLGADRMGRQLASGTMKASAKPFRSHDRPDVRVRS